MKLSPQGTGGTESTGNTMPRELNPAQHGENAVHIPVPSPAHNVDLSTPNCLRQFKKSITMVISLFHGRTSC